MTKQHVSGQPVLWYSLILQVNHPLKFDLALNPVVSFIFIRVHRLPAAELNAVEARHARDVTSAAHRFTATDVRPFQTILVYLLPIVYKY